MQITDHFPDHGKAISSLLSLSLITLQGNGMIGVPGIAAKLFDAIAAQKINVLFISQSSSEYNISFVIKNEFGKLAIETLEKTFRYELLNNKIATIYKEDGMAIIAVVGEGMKGKPGTAGKIFSALGDANINTIAIAQGSSERNISFVVKETDMPTAVQSIHERIIMTQ